MKEFDERLAKIRQKRTDARTTAADDFAQLREGLAEAQSKLAELDAARQTLSEAVKADSRRIAALRRRVTVGVVLLALVGALVLALTGAFASRMVDEARTEAARIRTENAQEIAEARAEGEAALQALADRLASREAALSTNIEAMGADLAQLAADRDAARADLEHFADLRQQIGFDLIPYRDRVVIVVPQGETITRWNAPGLSDLARYNGRMFRVVEVD
jgi:DNA repair exonuclease SbcCD ATPase subunit